MNEILIFNNKQFHITIVDNVYQASVNNVVEYAANDLKTLLRNIALLEREL